MKRKILAFLGAVILGAGVVNLGMGMRFNEVRAACNQDLFGLRAWYYGLVDGSCKVEETKFSETELPNTTRQIIMNVLYDLFYVAGVGAVVMIVYSGYLMITAMGEVGKVEKAKKSLRMAITGLVICILADLIVATIERIFW